MAAVVVLSDVTEPSASSCAAGSPSEAHAGRFYGRNG
jgi:hypothetical protein